MASKVKIAQFVASTARYAKKAALAADKNENGKLSKTEAQSLPKDLRDDYARQAKTKNVTTTSFAADQAAYVAAASRRADKNKDGVLTATEARSLPAAVKNNYQNYAASLDSTPGVAPGGFVGKGAGKIQLLGGKPFSNLPLSASIGQLVAQLATDSGNSTVYAAAFKGKPSDLAAALAAPQSNKQFFNDLLFRATGTTYDLDRPDYYTPQGLTVTPLSASQARAGLISQLSGTTSPNHGSVTADTKVLIEAMKGPGVKFFELSWNNGDETSFDATVAINPATGQIKATGWFSEP